MLQSSPQLQRPSLEAALNDPAASDWLKACLRAALCRDPVDAATDAEILAALLHDRATQIMRDVGEFPALPAFALSAGAQTVTAGDIDLFTFASEMCAVDRGATLRQAVVNTLNDRPALAVDLSVSLAASRGR